MTISYSGSFFRILLRWKGSIWKSVWKELLVFLILFYLIRFSVDPLLNYMDPSGIRSLKIKYKSMCSEFNEYTKLIPLTFLLGFYVSNVVSRWWHQFECLKWPEDLLSALCLVIPSKESRTARHQFARYVNLTAALAWRDVSSKIRLRFPQIENLIDVGLLTDRELSKLLSVNNSSPGVLWMTPLHWCQQILSGEVSAGRAQFQFMSAFTQELRAYRGSFRKLYCHDWVCVPLVYTQVAAISTYTYFFFCLFGRQKFGEEDSISSFPLFTIVQFLFFVGWFKVGQDLMRPFGLDDDDFELSYILDRNIITSFTIVDTLQDDAPPPFEEDVYWRYYRQSESSETKPNSNLKWGRVDLSRTSHKHPPKLHTFLEMKGLISSDDEKKGRKNK